ncbi:MAG: tetratricopeptide repeat protein [Microscillaceae bacterium]|nr:tetratricopeptide repeat protein [Microscillaceae bacterium]
MADTKFFSKNLALLGLLMVAAGASPQLLAQTATEYIVRGQQKMQQRAYTEAIEDFEHALKLNETLEEAHLLKGQSFFYLRSFPEALNAFTQAIQYAPDVSETYYWRSKAQLEAGDYHLALWDAVKATKILSDKPDYYVQSGWVNFCLERYNKAAEDAQTALGYQSSHAEALCLLGRVRLAEGKLTEARQYFAQAVKASPENALVYFHQAEYFIQEKEYNQAIEVLTASIHLLPQQPEAHFKRALLKLSLDNDLEAQKDANRAILHDRRFWKAYALRGIASYNLQEKDRHEYDFRVYLTQAKTAKDFSFLAEQICFLPKMKIIPMLKSSSLVPKPGP